jgi:hypothetical protein
MDHSRAPVLDALVQFRNRGDIVCGPPVTSRDVVSTSVGVTVRGDEVGLVQQPVEQADRGGVLG